MGNRILIIGNSFSVDTMQHVAKIIRKAGGKNIRLGTLYIGGCSVNMHLKNALENNASYIFYTNSGTGWREKPDVSIQTAIDSQDWDWIIIQSGTHDGSRNTSAESLNNLPALVEWVRSKKPKARVAFSMTWVGESWHTHPEIVSYDGDVQKMYAIICDLMKDLAESKLVDYVCPVGTAINNARKNGLADKMNRDGYHLSLGLGRFTAGLALAEALSDISVENLEWQPQGVTEEEREIAKKSAIRAVKVPFEV